MVLVECYYVCTVLAKRLADYLDPALINERTISLKL